MVWEIVKADQSTVTALLAKPQQDTVYTVVVQPPQRETLYYIVTHTPEPTPLGADGTPSTSHTKRAKTTTPTGPHVDPVPAGPTAAQVTEDLAMGVKAVARLQPGYVPDDPVVDDIMGDSVTYTLPPSDGMFYNAVTGLARAREKQSRSYEPGGGGGKRTSFKKKHYVKGKKKKKTKKRK